MTDNMTQRELAEELLQVMSRLMLESASNRDELKRLRGIVSKQALIISGLKSHNAILRRRLDVGDDVARTVWGEMEVGK